MHTSSYRVYYEDTDSGGVVYYANYLKFAERARSDIMIESNINQEDFLSQYQECFVVSNINVKYIKSAKLMDILQVNTNIVKINKASIEMMQTIMTKNEICAILNVKIAYVKNVDSNFKPIKIPSEILNKLQHYVKST